MTKIYTCTFEVRGYELDSFGHVNHAVYVQYLEHARWKLLAEENITLINFETWGAWPVIAEIQVKYLKPTFLGDQILIETQLGERSRSQFSFHQRMLKAGELACEANIRAVTVDQNGKPRSIPEQLQKLWVQN